MKNCYCFFSSILIFSFLHAQNNQELFLQANDAYEQQHYDRALELYEKIPNKSSAIWFNMGNSAYKKDNVVDALVYWKRAQKQANSEQYDHIEKNIALLAQQQNVDYQPVNWFSYFFKKLSRRFSLLFWQLLFLLCWLVLWFVIYVGKKKRLLVGSALLGLLFFGTILFLKNSSKNEQRAIVKQESPVYIGPSDQFAKLALLKKAQEVIIKEKKENWYKIICSKNIGWISGYNIIEV